MPLVLLTNRAFGEQESREASIGGRGRVLRHVVVVVRGDEVGRVRHAERQGLGQVDGGAEE